MADAKLVDMAYTKAELKEKKKDYCCPSGSMEPYPWGLAIRLEKTELEKLGIAQLPAVGTEVNIVVVAKVTSVNQSARTGQDEESCVGLQITQMQVGPMQAPAAEAAPAKAAAKQPTDSRTVASKYQG